MKIERTVLKETKHLSIAIFIFSMLGQMMFFLMGKYNYTVLLGFIYGGIISVSNFWLLGITLEYASAIDDQDIIKKKIQLSYRIRSFGIIILLILGMIIPIFNKLAIILSVTFPKIYFLTIPFFRKKLV